MVRLTDCPDIIITVNHGCSATKQKQQKRKTDGECDAEAPVYEARE